MGSHFPNRRRKKKTRATIETNTWFVWFLVCYSFDFVTSIYHISFIWTYMDALSLTHICGLDSLFPSEWMFVTPIFHFYFSSKEMSHHSQTQRIKSSIADEKEKKLLLVNRIEKQKKKKKMGDESDHTHTHSAWVWWHWKEKWHFLCKNLLSLAFIPKYKETKIWNQVSENVSVSFFNTIKRNGTEQKSFRSGVAAVAHWVD